MKKLLLLIPLFSFCFGCATIDAVLPNISNEDGVGQFKSFDEKLNTAVREDAQNEIMKCQNYDISDVDKKQCALCGEYVIYVMDWKDAKKAEVKQLLDLTKISSEIGDNKIRALSFAADIAYGKALADPKEQLDKIGKEAIEKAINLKNACAPLFTRVKGDLAQLGINFGKNMIQLPR